jgi:hypothetical protein
MRLRAHLDRSLFLDPPPERRRLGHGEAAIVAAALVVLAMILQLFRVGPSVALNSLWAEDGQIFLQGGLQSGLHATFDTYAGYLVLVPRLIGEVGALVPLEDAAAAISIASTLVVAISGLAIWCATAAFIRNPYLRGTLVLLTVLSPVASLESVASGAYVSWYMLFASFWLLLWRPRTDWGAALAGLFLLATGLSSPGLWFFAPIALLRALAARDRRDLMILGGFAIGAVAQVPVLLFNTEEQVTPLWTSDIWTAYLQRVVDGATFGDRLGGIAWAHYGWPFLIALLACLIAAVAIALRGASSQVRWLAATAIPISIVMFVVSIYQRALGSQVFWPAGTHSGAAGRYAIVPALLLVSVALVAIDRRPPRPPWGRWVAISAIALLLGGAAVSFDVEDRAARGEPPWRSTVAQAAAACTSRETEEETLPISPPGFSVRVPCRSLP